MSEPRNIRCFSVDDVLIPEGRRQLQEDKVEDIAAAMKKIGLLHPVTVRVQGDEHYLIDGLHRLTAAQRLGWKEIDCEIIEADDRRARMLEIAANLHRAELTKLERAEAIAEWVRLAEEEHEDISAQVAQKNKRGRPEGGRSAAAREIGVDRDTVRRAQKIAALPAEAKVVARDLSLEDNQQALLEAAKSDDPIYSLHQHQEQRSHARERAAERRVKSAEQQLGHEHERSNASCAPEQTRQCDGRAADTEAANGAVKMLRERLADDFHRFVELWESAGGAFGAALRNAAVEDKVGAKAAEGSQPTCPVISDVTDHPPETNHDREAATGDMASIAAAGNNSGPDVGQSGNGSASGDGDCDPSASDPASSIHPLDADTRKANPEAPTKYSAYTSANVLTEMGREECTDSVAPSSDSDAREPGADADITSRGAAPNSDPTRAGRADFSAPRLAEESAFNAADADAATTFNAPTPPALAGSEAEAAPGPEPGVPRSVASAGDPAQPESAEQSPTTEPSNDVLENAYQEMTAEEQARDMDWVMRRFPLGHTLTELSNFLLVYRSASPGEQKAFLARRAQEPARKAA